MDSANICGLRLQFEDSAYELRNLLTISGLRLQLADSTYSCGFHDSLSFLNTYIIMCLCIQQIVPVCNLCCGFHQNLLRILQSCLCWSDFEQYSLLGICPWNPKQQKNTKRQKCGFRNNSVFGLLRNPLTIQKMHSFASFGEVSIRNMRQRPIKMLHIITLA